MLSLSEKLTEEISRLLQSEKSLSSYALKARAYQNGFVQIQGIVDLLEEKQKAESLVAEFPGVTGVENNVTVCTDGAIDDEDVAFEVSEELRANPVIPDSVGVKVYGGAAQLVGSVSSQSEAVEAAEAARKARGVREVNNRLRVEDNYEDPDITNHIQSALMRELDLVCGRVRVITTAGVVTLNGVLSKENAIKSERIASEIPGVKKVINKINIDEEIYTNTIRTESQPSG